MKKKLWYAVALALLLAWPLGSAFAGDAHVSKTGTLYLDKTKAYNGTICSPASRRPALNWARPT